jgi:hypothetical protein
MRWFSIDKLCSILLEQSNIQLHVVHNLSKKRGYL